MIPDDFAIEAHHLNLQINQEQAGDQIFALVGHVSAVDPTTNMIKAVIPTWTNDNQTYMETGWIPLGTMKAGNQAGIQILPFGGATVTDLTGQVNTPNAQPEQVLVHILGRKKGFYVAGVQRFNQIDVPPSGYEDKSKVQAAAGEWLFKHETGSYLYFSNKQNIHLEALTNPAPVLQVKDAPDTNDETIVISSASYGKNSNTNGDTVKTGTSLVEIVSDCNGASQTTSSTLQLSSIQTTPEADATNTCTANINVGPITAGQVGNAHLNLVASSTGAQTNNAQFNLTASTEQQGPADGLVAVTSEQGEAHLNVTASSIQSNSELALTSQTQGSGTATQDVLVQSQSGTAVLNINVVGNPNTININVNGGTVNLTSDTTNIMSGTINLGTGSMKRILNDVAAQIYNSHTHPGVTSGPDTTGVPNQTITSSDESQNAYSS